MLEHGRAFGWPSLTRDLLVIKGLQQNPNNIQWAVVEPFKLNDSMPDPTVNKKVIKALLLPSLSKDCSLSRTGLLGLSSRTNITEDLLT